MTATTPRPSKTAIRRWAADHINPASRRFAVLNWALQFTLLVVIIFFQGANSGHGTFTMQMSPTRMAEIFGYADAGSYLQAAQNLVANGRILPEWAWVYNLWPPGMIWLDALVLRLSPLAFGVTIGILTAFVWSMVLAILTRPFIRSLKLLAVILIVELLALGTSPFQSWMFDEGLLYADALATGFFLLGLALIVNRVRVAGPVSVWIRDGIFAGIAFAAAIYLRSSYQLVPWALGLVAVLVALAALVSRGHAAHRRNLRSQAALLAAAALSVVLLMQPYLTFVQQTMGRSQFVTTESLVYEDAWKNPETQNVPEWLVSSGSDLGCSIDLATCKRLEDAQHAGHALAPDELRNALIKSILTHPAEYVANRATFLTKQWFGDETASYSHKETNYATGPVSLSSSDNLNPPQGMLYLILLAIAVGAAIILARRGQWALLILPILAAALLAPFAIVHIEVRYLIPIKLIGLLAPVLLLMVRDARASQKQRNGRVLGIGLRRRS